LAGFSAGWGAFGFHRWNKPIEGPVNGLAESTTCAEPEIPSRSQRYPEHKKGRSDARCGLNQNPR
jgi:hypothetical protein